MDENTRELEKSKLALVFAIIGLIIGLIALPLAAISIFGPSVLGAVSPPQLLISLAPVLIAAKYISYASQALALTCGLTAVITASLKRTHKVFPILTVAVALVSVGVSVAGVRLKATPKPATSLDPQQLEEIMKYRFSSMKAELTPLLKAAEAGKTEEVRALLQEGADPFEKCFPGWTAGGLAVKNGHVETVKALLEKEAVAGDKEYLGGLLRIAAEHNRIEITRLLLENKAVVNKSVPGDDWTPLMYAASYGHEEVADMLIENDADLNYNVLSGTPMSIAAYAGQLKMVEKFLNLGADMNAQSSEGYTPLMTACSAGRTSVVKLLISRGANWTLRDKYGHTAMEWAAHEGHIDLVRTMQQLGVKK